MCCTRELFPGPPECPKGVLYSQAKSTNYGSRLGKVHKIAVDIPFTLAIIKQELSFYWITFMKAVCFQLFFSRNNPHSLAINPTNLLRLGEFSAILK
jgi:hypothetical protein